jgi:hypothetical protein
LASRELIVRVRRNSTLAAPGMESATSKNSGPDTARYESPKDNYKGIALARLKFYAIRYWLVFLLAAWNKYIRKLLIHVG